MSFSSRIILMAAALPLVAGCDSLRTPLDKFEARNDARTADGKRIPPGLEPLYVKQEPPPPLPPEAPRPRPEPPPASALPFPQGRLEPAQAEALLAGDPMALRFLGIKRLAEAGLLPVEDAGARKDANLGALLPLSATQPPAAGLERPTPPLPEVVRQIRELGEGKGRGTDASRAAEAAFLLDSLLPKEPKARQPWSPPDIASARMLQQRLARLEDAGLITPEERAKETAAVDALIAGGTLPEVLAPPKPPEVPKPKKKAGSGRSGARMPGGVSGKLEVIPSPAGVEPPRLAPGAKGPAGIHLLSMGTAAHGDKAWESLTKEHPELASLGFTVSRADLGELGVTHRLIAGPIEPAEAEKLCAVLKPRGQTCTPTPFPPK